MTLTIKIEFPEMFLVADLTDKPIKTGFPWKESVETEIDTIQFGLLRKRVKQGFLSRLFGGKK